MVGKTILGWAAGTAIILLLGIGTGWLAYEIIKPRTPTQPRPAVAEAVQPQPSPQPSVQPASQPATQPAEPLPADSIKVGVVVSAYSAGIQAGSSGFDLLPRRIEALRDPSIDLYPIIEPGTEKDAKVAAVLATHFAGKATINGADAVELGKLHVILLTGTHQRDDVLNAIETAVNEGTGLLAQSGVCMLSPGYTPQVNRLLGLEGARYAARTNAVECAIVADHPLLARPFAESGRKIHLKPNGAFGKLAGGTPLLRVDDLSAVAASGDSPPADAAFCPLYVGQLGKGRIVGCAFAFYEDPPAELRQLLGERIYVRCAKWLAGRPLD